MGETHRRSEACMNCGAALAGPYCSGCGQKDQERRLPLGHVLHEVLEDLWHLDARLLLTLRLLLGRPGFLTTEFMAGRRARYIPPFRLYLIVSFVLFATMSLLKPKAGELRPVVAPGGQAKVEARALDISLTKGKEKIPLGVGDPKVARTGMEGLMERGAVRANQDPAAFWAAFRTHLPRAMFVLLPLFALLLKLLHWRSRAFFVEHMVFSLHFHSFHFLLILLWIGLDRLLPGLGGWKSALLLAVPVYLGAGMRQVYRQSWPWTLLKLGLLSLVYLLLLLTALVLVAIATLAMLA